MTQFTKWVLTIIFSVTLLGKANAATDVTTLTADIDTLIAQGNDVLAEMTTTSLTLINMASALEAIDASVSNYTNNVIAVFNTLDGSNTMTLTSELLVGMQTLSTTSLSIANALVALSNQVVSLAPLTTLSTLDSSLAAMLRLSDDIGTMADRIGEMADDILVMADNIGIMADRILATQVIQGDNIALTLEAILQTQKNTLALFSMYSL